MAWKAAKWVCPDSGEHCTTGDFMCSDKTVVAVNEKTQNTVTVLTGDHGDECLILNFYRPKLLRMDSCGLL